MNEITFQVQGSAEARYEVVFIKRSNTKLSAHCSCPAGENDQYCKHRFNILAGVTKGIASSNLEDVAIVQSWLEGTELEGAIQNMRKLEAEADMIKKTLSMAKKAVASAMHY